MLEIVFHLIGFLVFAAIVLVITQDLQVFPGALLSLFQGSGRDPKSLPPEVESFFVETCDKKRLEVWRLAAEESENKKPFVGLVFHGNAGMLEDFLLLQLWFQEMGITSYMFDYRGFGKSSGWPTEDGVNRDSDAVWNFVLEQEQVDPSQVIVLGFSVGGAPAARIASICEPRMLVLVAAFSSIREVVRENVFLRFLLPFFRYKMPTIDYVKALRGSDLLLLHGEKDSVVPAHHTAQLKEAYCGSGSCRRITLASGDHNTVFFAARRELAQAALELLG